jgi:CMP-2-keto-3-deoxyoctulosonic acid synthetase
LVDGRGCCVPRRLPAALSSCRPRIEEHQSLEQLQALWHGYRIVVLTLDGALPTGVDTVDDLRKVRELIVTGSH